MDVAVETIAAVVISHDHWDHSGGLWRLLEETTSPKEYACPGFSSLFRKKVKELGGRLIEASAMVQITPQVYASSELIGSYKETYLSERALVIDGTNGLSIITGCAHPGIVQMVREVQTHFSNKKISLVMGGFHLMRQSAHIINSVVKEFKELGIASVGPTHCSGDDAENAFRAAYKENFQPVMVGDVIVVA